MAWWQFAVLGGAGGAVVEALAVLKWVTVWVADRRLPTGSLKAKPPGWRRSVDVPALAWLLPIRAALGVGSALLFGATGQIDGAYAAIACGFAAPAMLAQLGSVPQIAAAASGRHTTSATAPQLADVAVQVGDAV
jgi:hypothetical protein